MHEHREPAVAVPVEPSLQALRDMPGDEPCPLCGEPASNAVWAPRAACWIKTHLACLTNSGARAKMSQFVGVDHLDDVLTMRPASDVLDAPVPYAITPAGEAALGAPTVRGVVVTRDLVVSIGRVEAAHAIARSSSPGLALGDFISEVRAAEVRA